MATARWNGVVIAQSDRTEIVEGNIYFPPDSVDRRYLEASEKTTVCPWKGTARYFTLAVNGERNPDAAWHYPETRPKAEAICGYLAFWRGVQVEP